MNRKTKYKLSEKERKNPKNKIKTPLAKVDDVPSVDEIIKDDAMLIKTAFVAELMVRNLTVKDMQAAYEEHFGESITYYKMSKLRNATRMVYLSQIAKERDELIAEELMQADWELRELKEYWENSKQGKLKKTKHKANSKGSEMMTYNLDEETEEAERMFGDLKAMERIDSVRKRIISILGLEAPKQQPQQQNNGNLPTVTINVVGRRNNDIKIEDVQVVNE